MRTWESAPSDKSQLAERLGEPMMECHPDLPSENSRDPWDLIEACRELFPNGHRDFIQLSLDEMALHSKKNLGYAASGDPIGNFKRAARIFELYPNLSLSDPTVVALVWSMKHLDAIMLALSTEERRGVDTIDERLADIGVYVKLMRFLEKEKS